ncbi:hypothetical protein R1flu_009467 [Riccia fluitans]|uniref:Uncharacterized protein n=1 Tax=Riccia fluitans TaxID=41844 RepID=A0ABD1Z264_9MARC
MNQCSSVVDFLLLQQHMMVVMLLMLPERKKLSGSPVIDDHSLEGEMRAFSFSLASPAALSWSSNLPFFSSAVCYYYPPNEQQQRPSARATSREIYVKFILKAVTSYDSKMRFEHRISSKRRTGIHCKTAATRERERKEGSVHSKLLPSSTVM